MCLLFQMITQTMAARFPEYQGSVVLVGALAKVQLAVEPLRSHHQLKI